MQHTLTTFATNGEALRDRFLTLNSPGELATLLGIEYSRLRYLVYRTPRGLRYHVFEIPKRSGGVRLILAPNRELKSVQRRLNEILKVVYGPNRNTSAHGFLPERSIITNARLHTGRKFVLNLDLQDFFPSINFGRVRGLFMAWPYELPTEVATILAQICCFDNQLPQGAPTSPIVSNMICAKLDITLQRLAARNKCVYTRYADDITFSTYLPNFPAALASLTPENKVELGQPLTSIIKDSGFVPNDSKVRLQVRPWRQIVTGLIVNKFPNVDRQYTRQIRAMLYAWETFGYEAAQTQFLRCYDVKQRSADVNARLFAQVIRGRIEFLGAVKGKTHRLYLGFLEQLNRLEGRALGKNPTLENPDSQMAPKATPVHEQATEVAIKFSVSELPPTGDFIANPGNQNAESGLIDVAIMTVLAEESNAVAQKLTNLKRVAGSNKRPNIYDYQYGSVPCASYGLPYRVVLGRLGRAGNTQGALGIMSAIERWSPRYVLLVGIAGGFAKDNIQLGDVVFSDVICGYEYGKLDKGEFILKPHQIYQSDVGLLNGALGLANKIDVWAQDLKDGKVRRVTKAIKGVVASGDKVVDDPTVPFFQQAQEKLGPLHAIEMEGVGASAAIDHAHALGKQVGFMMVRGISDMPKGLSELGLITDSSTVGVRATEERDTWKMVAAEAAAAFAIALISSGLPKPPRGLKGSLIKQRH
jgi:RNA-directed DNA polymerase